jgi:hypothetical protein
MVNVGILCDHLEYFMAIWYNLWPFWYSLWSLVIFFPFWYVWTKKNLATRYVVPHYRHIHGQALTSLYVDSTYKN